MRSRLLMFAPLAFAFACTSGSLSPQDARAIESELTAQFAGLGVRCLHREPPPFHACNGLDAGAPCAMPDDDRDGGEAGMCKSLHDGRLVCIDRDEDDDDESRDGGKEDDDGDEGRHGRDGGLGFHDGGLPPSIQAALDACASHAADDPCSFTFREHAFQGACRRAPDGTTLICAPMCPKP